MTLKELAAKHADAPLAGRLEFIRAPQQVEIVEAALAHGFIEVCNALQVTTFELERVMLKHNCHRCEDCGEIERQGEVTCDEDGNPCRMCSVCGHQRAA